MDSECIFCQIVEGSSPATKIFENDYVVAFLDIFPIAHGHTLVIPKEHSKNLLEVSDEYLEEVLKAAKKVGAAQMKGLGVKGFNVLQSNNPVAGQVVFHTHFHVIPRKEGDGLKFPWPAQKANEKYLKEVSETLKKNL